MRPVSGRRVSEVAAMSGFGSVIRARRGSLGAKPKLGSRIFGRRSTSVTEHMIRAVVDKINVGKELRSAKTFNVIATLPDASQRTVCAFVECSFIILMMCGHDARLDL